MKKTICLVFIVIASGCATYPNTYNSGVLSNDELAKVTFEKTKMWDGNFSGSIVAVLDEAGNKVIQVQEGIGFGTRRHEEVFLPEGKYLIVANCTNGSLYSNPVIPLTLEKRETYMLACRKQTEKGFLGLPKINSISLELLPHKN